MKKPANDPRISVNKLAEYIGSRAPRQRQILRDQKYPTDFKGMYYREASEAISSCIVSGGDNLLILDKAIASLEQFSPESIGTQRRLGANIDALENFRLMLDDVFPLVGEPRLGAISTSKLSFFNVGISVRPDVLLRSAKGNVTLLGAIKLHFPKTFSLDDDAASIVSAVMQEWFKTCHPDDGVPSGQNCYVIDVGTRRVCKGAKSTVARMREVQANCQNIVALWPSITPSG